MSKRLRRQLERNQARIAARPPKPMPLDPVAAKEKVDAFRQGLFENARKAIGDMLEAHKRENGLADIDRVTIAASVVAFAHFMNGNRKFVAGQDTDALINLGVDAVSRAGAEARRQCEDRRVVLA